MATKWKNRFLICLWAIMFTLGLSGILSVFANGGGYIHEDYFHTPEFQSELDQSAGYLSMFELNPTTLEEAKKSITVTEDEINEHRYRYGSLPEQIENIKAQYEERIQGAKIAENKEALDAFIAERDTKIADITNNFKSDEYVSKKVKKEKEKRIEEYYHKRENYRSDYLRYKESFHYYFKNSVTGKVYTDLNLLEDDSVKDYLNEKDMLFVTPYTITRDHFINYGPFYDNVGLLDSIIPQSTGVFEGQLAVPKSLSASNLIIKQYKNYKQNQLFLLIFALTSILALSLCYILRKKVSAAINIEKWKPYYNKLPIDIRAAFLILTASVAFVFIVVISMQLLNIMDSSYDAVESIVLFVLASCLWGITLVQWKFISGIKNWQDIKAEWEKSLLKKTWKFMKLQSIKLVQNVKEAFLNRTIGTQLFIMLGVVFGLGLSAIMVLVHPIFLFLYMLMLAFLGLPVVMTLIKRIGYFNQIFEKTNELATGKLGEDLTVSGKSVLATLASNINVLKTGVKTSQNEQAKSERLKTELITNVSHDLRTPLTSIITYTELLKKENLSNEEKSVYLEIIDRKSKRLKVLIEDLFEVSKMASGNIELTKERVDLVQLLQQALAEHDNTINDSSLTFRITSPEKPIYAFVDGQKLWRVFDNLIGNILKYSLENSRVYIHVETVNDEAMITFKNISKYELNDNSDELYERFKRGDTSRHTDGSGLGLAIAKSIIDLHDGSLDIETDGDLFKVSIALKVDHPM